MADIAHLVKGNQNREARVDKIETDKLNSIVERISGVNPSKLAAEVAGKKVESTEPAAPPVSSYGAGPAHELAAVRRGAGTDPMVAQLMQEVAQLKRQVALQEVTQDNDPVMQMGGKQQDRNRGDNSSVFARDVSKKKLKSKDPGDGKADAPATQAQPEGPMAGERVNILGISMNEWRGMAGLGTTAVNLTNPPPAQLQEAYEDEDEDDMSNQPDLEMIEHQLWASFLEDYDMTPDEFAVFVEEADEAGDEEALVAVQELEDEFVEAFEQYIANELAEGQQDLQQENIDGLWAAWLEEHGLSVETFDALAEAVETDEDRQILINLQDIFESEVLGGMDEDDDMDETFECDADESGEPDQNHPGFKKAFMKHKMARGAKKGR